jgi:hypothetical protein
MTMATRPNRYKDKSLDKLLILLLWGLVGRYFFGTWAVMLALDILNDKVPALPDLGYWDLFLPTALIMVFLSVTLGKIGESA